eukprot:Colp12_sorted_trinity150504_noHs@32245
MSETNSQSDSSEEVVNDGSEEELTGVAYEEEVLDEIGDTIQEEESFGLNWPMVLACCIGLFVASGFLAQGLQEVWLDIVRPVDENVSERLENFFDALFSRYGLVVLSFYGGAIVLLVWHLRRLDAESLVKAKQD